MQPSDVNQYSPYMLSNRKYIGEYRYARTVIPDGAPAIIARIYLTAFKSGSEKIKKRPQDTRTTTIF
jgi:hypothetical protein